MVRREVGQRGGQTAHMVFVGVGAEDVFQLLHTLALQVGDDETAVVHIAAVVEHVLPVALHQHAEGLAHVNEVHLKGCFHRVRRGCGRRRVRDDIRTAARRYG